MLRGIGRLRAGRGGPTQVATPQFSPAAGGYGPTQNVTITCATVGATIYYTTDGSDPDSGDTEYTTPIEVAATTTIKAIAIDGVLIDSAIASATYTINGQVQTPTFDPAAGTYGTTQNVTISSATGGTTIYYTTNGDAPTTGSTLYTGAVEVSASLTLKALAVKTGYTDSAVGSAAYVISATDADAQDWADRVTAAGGTYAAGTLTAVSDFCVAAKANNYWAKLLRINVFAGAQLTAALVPLKVGGGNATDTNTNFVSGDYSLATGLTGNASNKYLLTGIIPNTMLSANDTHLAVYNRSSSGSSGFVMTALSGSNRLQMLGPFSGDSKVYSDQYDETNGRLSTGSAIGTPYGFLIGTRTASNSHAVYRNGSSAATNATSGGSLPTGQVSVFARADGTFANGYSLGMYSIGAGLTGTDATNFNTDIQALMTALGRNV